MKKTYKSIIIDYLNINKKEVSINELFDVINQHYPKERKSGDQYLRELITNRYKGSDIFYIKEDYVGLNSWINNEDSKKPINKANYVSLEDKKYIEGQLQETTVLSRKRNSIIVKECKKRDNYTCQSCGFYYDNKIVEAHHLNPLYDVGTSEISKNDLITLCPTCHKLAHFIIREEECKSDELRANYKNKKVIINLINSTLHSSTK